MLPLTSRGWGWVSIKAGATLEEVGMKQFSEGWAGPEQTEMKLCGGNLQEGEQTPNISKLEGLALSLQTEAGQHVSISKKWDDSCPLYFMGLLGGSKEMKSFVD